MRVVILALLIISILVAAASAKHCKKQRHAGCRLFQGRCSCDEVRACHSPFPYNTEKECIDDAKGLNDQCAGHPCTNGVCLQILHHGMRGWYCECAGTGYYGKMCEQRCPPGSDPIPENYPTACVMTDDIYKEY